MDLLDLPFMPRNLLSIAANTVKHNEIYYCFLEAENRALFRSCQRWLTPNRISQRFHRTPGSRPPTCTLAHIPLKHTYGNIHAYILSFLITTLSTPSIFSISHSAGKEKKKKQKRKKDGLSILLHSLLSIMKERRPSLCECECIFNVNARTIVRIHTFSFNFIAF